MNLRTKVEFEKDLQNEIAKSEFRRIHLVIGCLLIAAAVGFINEKFFIREVDRVFQWVSYKWLFIWLAVFILYEISVLRYIRQRQKNEKSIPAYFRILNVLDEVTFPSILLAIFIFGEQNPAFLDSPISFIYYILIVLSALHLDFRLSLLTGVAAGVQYCLITWWALDLLQSDSYQTILPQNVYYIRGIELAIAGTCAGFVAREIRKRIVNAFQSLQEKNQVKQLFGQQVSKEVVETLISLGEKSKKVKVSVLFMDIRDFSAFAETKSPDEIISFQNMIFDPVIEIINSNQGIVNQILGDGLMATFGTPIADELHSAHALKAGKEILQRIDQLNEGQLIPHTRIGIGIHTGEVVTGNIGNQQRKQFSISGNAVIIASRLEQLNKNYDSRFLVSGEVIENVSDNTDQFQCLGKIRLKGIAQKIEVFKVQ